jgi:hypothetical protein
MFILELALAAVLTTRGTIQKTPAPPPPPAAEFGAGLAKAIKTDLEAISGPGSVDVSVENENLFSVRIALPNFSPELYTPIFDRELKLYRIFPDLNFDFYLRLKPEPTEQPHH